MRSTARRRATRRQVLLSLVLAVIALGRAAAPPAVAAAETSAAADLGPALQQIEKVTGTFVGEQFASTFYDPLGLSHTYFQGDGPPPDESAKGYLLNSSGVFRE